MPEPGEYFLAEWIGQGTENNPFRPQGGDPGIEWSAISLRNSGTSTGTQGFNKGFVWFPPGTTQPQQLYVASHFEEIISDAKAALLETQLKLVNPLVERQFNKVVLEIALNPPPNGWRQLQPSKGASVYEVYLRGLLIQVPVP